MVALESTALSLAKTIVQKAAGAWIADRRTAEERKKELTALLTPRFRHAAPEQRFLDEAASELASFSHEFRGLDDGERAAALLAVRDAFERADLTDRALFAVDVDPAKLARRLRAGQPRAKTDAGLGEAGGAFYDAALDRCCELYVRAVEQVPAFVGRSLAEMLNRLSDLLPDQVAARVVNALHEAQAAVADPDGGVTVAGWPLEEVTDPFALEVHRPVQPEDAPPGLPLLPPYVPREHDQVLGQVVRAAAGGRSGIAVLVGGSSTGKTRACWEALALLRDQDPPWRLWHPIDPSRPDAALGELAGIGPRTVVWLNEAQFYLDPAEAGLGERVAAGLRELLRDPGRAPVLVLATVWPEFWDTLTARPAGGDDRHAQARELLAGHDITVPAAFTPAQMSQLAQAADARMVLAARSAPDGEVIQFLAGAPELLARYRNAPPAARALIHAAMDARRLGMGAGLPQAFLEAAAPGYLTDDQWDALGEDWLEQALAYTAVPCKGARGPLTRIRPRPARPAARNRGDQPASMAAAAGPLYRLADYLDQHGRAHRAGQIPPAEFWSAAAAHAAPGDQAALGDAAHARGLYRDAAQLHKNAAADGMPAAASRSRAVRRHCRTQHPRTARDSRRRPRRPHQHPDAGRLLAACGRRRRARAGRRAAGPEPAAVSPSTDPDAVAILLGACGWRARTSRPPRCWTGIRLPTSTSTTRSAWPSCWTACGRRARTSQAAALLARPAAHVALDNAVGVSPSCWTACGRRARTSQAAALLARIRPPTSALDNPYGRGRAAGQPRGRARTSRPPRWPAGPPASPRRPGRRGAAAGRPAGGGRARAGRHAGQPGRPCPPRRPARLGRLLRALREAGAHEQAAALLARNPAVPVPLDDPAGVGRLLGAPAGSGRGRAPAALLPRDPAAHAALDNPGAVALLLDALREAGADEQAATLLARNPAATPPSTTRGCRCRLLGALRAAGADEQAAALLAARNPAAPLPTSTPRERPPRCCGAMAEAGRTSGRCCARLREAGARVPHARRAGTAIAAAGSGSVRVLPF